MVGAWDVQVQYGDQTATLPLVVIKGNGSTLLGRNWLGSIRINSKHSIKNLLEKYDVVFQDKLGSFQGHQAKLLRLK